MIEPTATIQKMALEQTKLGATIVQSLEYEVHEDNWFQRALLHRLEAYALSEHLVTDRYVGERMFRTPATSWQMFKWEHAESWWLGWLVRRRPVRFSEQPHHVVVEVERKALYPQANIAVPNLGRPVIIERLTEVENR